MDLEQNLRRLIDNGFDGTQADFASALAGDGLTMTQSSISRCLKKMGAKKVQGKWQWSGAIFPKLLGNLEQHIISIEANETLIVVRTIPGSANVIAHALDQKSHSAILGTIAGDDTLFVAPASVSDIRRSLRIVKSILTEASG